MQTKELIAEIKQYYMREAAPEQVRAFLNRAYMRLVNSDISQFIFYDRDASGNPIPHIETGSDSLFYEVKKETLKDEDGYFINPSDPSSPEENPKDLEINDVIVWPRKIKTIFAESPNIMYGLEPFTPNAFPGYNFQSYNNYYKLPFQSTERRGVEQPPTFTLMGDYGVDNVYVLFYYTPSPILSENAKMVIDIDKWHELLINGTVGYYEDIVNGQSVRLQRFEQSDLKEFKAEINESMKHKKTMQMPTREF